MTCQTLQPSIAQCKLVSPICRAPSRSVILPPVMKNSARRMRSLIPFITGGISVGGLLALR